MVYLVDYYVDGDLVDDDSFFTLDEALASKYEWQSEDTICHWADVICVDLDIDKQNVVDISSLDHMVKAFFEVYFKNGV